LSSRQPAVQRFPVIIGMVPHHLPENNQ